MTERSESATLHDHYLDRVVEAGKSAGLVTASPVRDHNGMTLVGAGAPVNADLRERLLRHKLLRPIDESLHAERPVTVATLVERARELLSEQAILGRLAERVPDESRLVAIIRAIDLPPPIEIKLTVATHDNAERLDHLLTVTLTALAIGLRRQHSPADLKSLGLAALLHDLGDLHIDPTIFEQATGLSVNMRRQIEAHPVIMHTVLDAFGPRYLDAARAILEHHERVDGSGYPRGLTGERLSPLGRILALAEFVVSLRSRRECSHTLVALKLQRHHFDPELVAVLFDLIGQTEPPGQAAGIPLAGLTERLAQSQAHIENWIAISAQADSLGLPSAAMDWLHERSMAIERHFARLGLERNALEKSLAPIADDAEAIAELGIIAEEIERQVRDTAWEAHRRLGQNVPSDDLPEPIREGLLDVLSPSTG
ncbi:HD-GYP domain-containing protein [Guyparkeria sp.]|uniref:HD-GYP domain-containing protein n=1 Tax=Guyparkeria sp. TaxID=2035736 RepID=UPI003970A8AD